jgi:hypothetical protein
MSLAWRRIAKQRRPHDVAMLHDDLPGLLFFGGALPLPDR